MADLSDEALVEQARTSADAYALLVERYRHRIVTLAYRMVGDRHEAEDAAQEAFVRAYFALPRFRPGAAWSPWIYQIATNLCLTMLRRRKGDRQRLVELTPEIDPHDPADEPELVVLQQEASETVQRALLLLPPNYRAVIVLRHMEEMSYEQIAALLGVPTGTVKNWLFRARQQLQTRLARGE